MNSNYQSYNNNNSIDFNDLEGKERYDALLSQKEPEILKKWGKEQYTLKKKLIKEDDPALNNIKYIAGVDISFQKQYNQKKDSPLYAISALIVCDYKTLNIVYENYKLVTIDEPYIPGFLAFREVKHFVNLIEELKKNSPQYIPQVILVDGNGVFHNKGFGLASHLGVLVDIPTIGCGKTVFSVDGITKRKVENINYYDLKKKGDSKALIGKSGVTWGYALRSSKEYDDPMIISIGHKISNETALKIAKHACIYRVPEPIRLSDKISRRLIYAYQQFIDNNPKKQWDLQRYLKEKKKYIHGKLYEY
jgi:deoxyinosine 3'endonuclease (endonuclease V)